MIGEFQRNRVRLVSIAFLAVSLAVIFVIGAAPASAVEEIEFRIVGFGDGDCRTGSNKLIVGSAEPFLVEACAVESGDPLPDRTLTAIITHADGTTEERVLVTDADGIVTFEVVPVDAGLTTVEMCNDNGCDYGILEMKATDPPRPPLVASYGGPSSDLGESAVVADGEDDFDDPYTGGVASPGSGDPAMDIKSFRYLGTENGVARFEITTRGNAKALFDGNFSMVQLSMAVTTPSDARYVVTYRVSSGEVSTYAESDGAPLEGVVVGIEKWVNDSTVILTASGVDVPEGSTMRAGTWLIVDESNSGYQDFSDGTATPAAIGGETEEPTPVETGTGGGVGGTETDPATPVPISSDGEGGSLPGWLIFVGAAAVVGGGFWWWWSPHDPSTIDSGPGIITGTDDDPGIITDDPFPGIITDPRGPKGNAIGAGPDSPPSIWVTGPGKL